MGDILIYSAVVKTNTFQSVVPLCRRLWLSTGNHMQCITSRSIRMAALCARGAIYLTYRADSTGPVYVSPQRDGVPIRRIPVVFHFTAKPGSYVNTDFPLLLYLSTVYFSDDETFFYHLSCWTGRLIEFLFSPSDSFCGLYIVRWQFSWIRYILSRLHFVGSKC